MGITEPVPAAEAAAGHCDEQQPELFLRAALTGKQGKWPGPSDQILLYPRK